MASCSFDCVSKVDIPEVDNALNQVEKEITQRFDFKGSCAKVTREKEELVLVADDEGKLRSVTDILQTKLVKRKVDLKSFDYGTVEAALGGTVKQRVKVLSGIDADTARAIVKDIKGEKKKVQASIQGDLVRVSGKSRDELQEVIAFLRTKDYGRPLQFINFREN